jgi:hypothetical protein
MIEEEEIDTLEWEKLEPYRRDALPVIKPDVSLSLSKRKYKDSAKRKYRKESYRAEAVLWFRGDNILKWIIYNGPNFTVETGGQQAECLRLVADPAGPFKAADLRGIKKVCLGHVNLWPDEDKKCAVEFWFRPGYIVLKLPLGFASPSLPAPAKQHPLLINPGDMKVTEDERRALQVLLDNNTAAPGQLGLDDVSIRRLRDMMKPLGIVIETVFGGGLRLDAQSKARLRTLMDKQAGNRKVSVAGAK